MRWPTYTPVMSDPGRGTEIGDALERLFRDGRTNALLSWALVGVLALTLGESALDRDYQWVLLVAVAGGIVLLPPAAYREWRVMLPWELLVLALLPILARAVGGRGVGTFVTALALAALALIVIVELHTFTALQVTQWFAVVLVVLTTLASVGAWTVFRWNADRLFGTNYLTTNEALMAEWLTVTVAGLVAGVLFEGYFRRRDRILWRAIRRVVRR